MKGKENRTHLTPLGASGVFIARNDHIFGPNEKDTNFTILTKIEPRKIEIGGVHVTRTVEKVISGKFKSYEDAIRAIENSLVVASQTTVIHFR